MKRLIIMHSTMLIVIVAFIIGKESVYLPKEDEILVQQISKDVIKLETGIDINFDKNR
jgi:hypothetical protein